VWSNVVHARSQIYPGEEPKKSQTKILGPANIIWDQISEIWAQKSQPGNLGRGIGLHSRSLLRHAMCYG